jgi:hypothetical protein
MKPFKKVFRRLQERRNGCIQLRENQSKKNQKIPVELAFRMPGSMKK